MGNSSSSRKPRWPATNLFKRESKQKPSKRKINVSRVNSAPPVAPTYDTVAEVPVYSVVDKSRKKNIAPEDNVQYAEIEVVRRPPQNKSLKKPAAWQVSESTEYATINFTPPQDNHHSKTASFNQYSSVPPSSASESKPSRRYNSVNGTLV